MPHIPSEILLLIFEYLVLKPDHVDTGIPSLHVFHNVLPLLFVCQLWYNLFIYKVYYSLELHFTTEQLYLLARSLLENPGLGVSVHRLWLDFSENDISSSLLEELAAFEKDEHGFLEADESEYTDDDGLADNPQTKLFHEILILASPNRKERQRWQQHLIKGSVDAWMAIYFFLLPNLRYFKTGYLADSKTWCTLTLSRIATGAIDLQPRPLQFLEEVVIFGSETFTCRAVPELFPYFHFPAMRSLRGHGITDVLAARDPELCRTLQPGPRTSGITKLELSYIFSMTNVLRYIAACANLEVFKYEHTLDDMNGGFPVWNPRYLYQALTAQKHSLQVLYIGYWDIVGGTFADVYSLLVHRPALWSFGSLVGFTQLCEIDIPLGFFLQYPTGGTQPTLHLGENLPSSVEKLCLAEILDRDFAVLASELCAMLSCRVVRFPSLVGIELYLLSMFSTGRQGIWFENVLDDFEEVQEMCDAAGIQLRFSSYKESRPKLWSGPDEDDYLFE